MQVFAPKETRRTPLEKLIALLAVTILWTGCGLLGLVLENIAKYSTLRAPPLVETSEPDRFDEHLSLGPISLAWGAVQLGISMLKR